MKLLVVEDEVKTGEYLCISSFRDAESVGI
ncbi:hypothetical protein ACUXG4_006111 [Cupriavidus metallidurans]